MAGERLLYPQTEKDGSINWGDGVIGPSAEDIDWANGFKVESRFVQKPKENCSEHSSFLDRFPKSAKLAIWFGVPALTLAILSACGDTSENTGENTSEAAGRQLLPDVDSSENLLKGINLELPWKDADFSHWYLSGGPHADGFSQGVKYALDFTTKERVECPGNAIGGYFAAAVAEGEVILASDNPGGIYHSMVKIVHENGLITSYMHLDNIAVEVGQRVEQGQILGNPSCESPRGGRATGAHLHFGVENEEGPISIEEVMLSGWIFSGTSDRYDGKATKFPLEDRIADTRRCGPSEVSIEVCGGIRNDLTAVEVLGDDSIELPRAEAIEQNWQLVNSKVYKFFQLLKSGSLDDIEKAKLMLVSKNRRSEWNAYNLGSQDLINECSWEVSQGEFQNLAIDRHTGPSVNLSRLDLLNKERGLASRDRYTVSVSFDFRDWNSSYQTSDNRGPFREYDGISNNLMLSFEDVDGELLIGDLQVCMRSPLSTVVGQPRGR